jgi:hypothetical protein
MHREEPGPAVDSHARRTNLWMAAAMLFIGVANIRWAERLTAHDGLGWDGQNYAAWARDFFTQIFVVRVSEYYVKRILPSAIVHYGMRVFGVAPTNPNVIIAFDVFNLVLLVLGAYVWGLIADNLRISVRGKWLGFCFLFLNYAILKNNFYHTVLTDTAGFVLGILTFYFYVADRPLGLLAVIVVGGFTWPIVPLFAALLYVLPRRRPDAPPRPARRRWNVVIAAIAAAGAAAGILLLTGPFMAKMQSAFGGSFRIYRPFLYVSTLCSAAYVFFGLKAAADDDALFDLRAALAEVRWKRVAVVAVLFAILKLVTHSLANGAPEWSSLKSFTAYALIASVSDPLLFFIAHCVYYGPAVLVLAFFWRRFCDRAGQFGLGIRLLVIMTFLPSLQSQSRYGINLVAPLFAILVLLLDEIGLKRRDVAVLAVLSVAWSKVWFTMNTGPQVDDGRMETLLNGTLQRYFMNSGPWMSHRMYLVHLAAAAFTAIVLSALAFSRLRGRSVEATV